MTSPTERTRNTEPANCRNEYVVNGQFLKQELARQLEQENEQEIDKNKNKSTKKNKNNMDKNINSTSFTII